MGSFFSKPAPPAPKPEPVPELNMPANPNYANGEWAYRGGKSRKRSRKHKRKSHRRRR